MQFLEVCITIIKLEAEILIKNKEYEYVKIIILNSVFESSKLNLNQL